MGVVYEAFDPVIKRPLAIKTIRRELIQGGDSGMAAVARFRNEAQAAGRLRHPGIAAVYEYGEDELCSFIAMEYVAGSSLREYINKGTRFPEEDVLSIMVQMLDALEHAHSEGVWHRDIKPANLIVTREGRLKVADFGVARIEAEGLTLDGAVIGTSGYMAPEQYAGEAIDRRVDIYAAGVVMYQLVAGCQPFAGSAETVMYKTMTEVPVAPSRREGAQPFEHFDAVVLRALAKEADARYASAEEFKRALVEAGQRSPAPTMSEATLIMEPLRPGGKGPGSLATASRSDGSGRWGTWTEGARAEASRTGGSPEATVLAGWDPALLVEVESRLSRHLGPIARVMVRRAAARCTDVATLTAMLAEQIPAQEERTAFTAATRTGVRGGAGAAGRGPVATTARVAPATATAPTDSDQSGASGENRPLTPEFLEHATRLLAVQIGPIAKVLVRKAAEGVASRRAFAQRVVAMGSDLQQPEQLVAEILRGPG
jgi:serine/threonine-protein kinase